jgi:hypothetical protein
MGRSGGRSSGYSIGRGGGSYDGFYKKYLIPILFLPISYLSYKLSNKRYRNIVLVIIISIFLFLLLNKDKLNEYYFTEILSKVISYIFIFLLVIFILFKIKYIII